MDSKWFERPGKLLYRNIGSKRDPASGYRGGGISLDHRHRRNGSRHHAPRGHYCSPAYHHIRKNDDPGSEERILFNRHALSFPEVGDDRGAHADGTAVLDGNEIRAGCLQDDIIPDPYVSPDSHSSGAVQRDAKGSRTRQDTSQML